MSEKLQYSSRKVCCCRDCEAQRRRILKRRVMESQAIQASFYTGNTKNIHTGKKSSFKSLSDDLFMDMPFKFLRTGKWCTRDFMTARFPLLPHLVRAWVSSREEYRFTSKPNWFYCNHLYCFFYELNYIGDFRNLYQKYLSLHFSQKISKRILVFEEGEGE